MENSFNFRNPRGASSEDPNTSTKYLAPKLSGSLVRQLYKRHVLVLPINALETVSVDELKNAVKRVADGPKTWKVPSPTPPTVIRREVIPLPSAKRLRLIAACTLYTLVVMEPWNVTGGEDIRAVQFYEAETGRELWTWSISQCLIFSAAYDFSSFSTPLVVLSLQDL
ncbi:hypothetical protein R3P38DRAFT_3230023 [Favolaschia claudopus]|uniref:Uncharacterized protein n=1 Tax=Favolaschia claudopus TaxID=2862362 RepID=A0AAV9ZNB3_9AGAR